jgi:hypothetical protein
MKRASIAWSAAVLAALSTLSACTSGTSTADRSTTQPIRPTTQPIELIEHARGPLDVVIQLGDYNLGQNLDQFVWSPTAVIYGDGSFYAQVYDGPTNGTATLRLIRGTMTEAQLQQLLRQASSLPETAPAPDTPLAPDSVPTYLKVGGRQWRLDYPVDKQFAEFDDVVVALIEAAPPATWSPTRWVHLQRPEYNCVVEDGPSEDSLGDAPLYPHLADQNRLGKFDCDVLQATLNTSK